MERVASDGAKNSFQLKKGKKCGANDSEVEDERIGRWGSSLLLFPRLSVW